MIMDVDEQITEIMDFFPGTAIIKDSILEIPLFLSATIKVDLRKYPKRPKIILPKAFQKAFGDFEYFLSAYKSWNPRQPIQVYRIIQALQYGFETIAGKKVHFSDKIVNDICYMAKTAYPKEFFSLLRIVNGVLHEFILAPGTEASGISAVFMPSRVRGDKTLIATCHSHPTPNNHPSQADLNTFKKFYINIIIGAPFNVNTLGVYNFKGEPIPYEVHLVPPLDLFDDQEGDLQDEADLDDFY